MTEPVAAALAPGGGRRAYESILVAIWVECGLLVVLAGGFTALEVGLTVTSGSGSLIAVLLALAPVPVLVGIGLWLDRFEPEPPWLLARTFLWGALVATFVGGVVNSTVGAFAGEWVSAVVSAPIGEELLKGLAVLWTFRHRREHLHGVLDGVVYALFVGLGFAVVENVQHYAAAAQESAGTLAAVVVLRGVMTPFLHPFFTICTGIAIGIASREHGRTRWGVILVGYLAAVLLHAVWNSGAGVVVAPITFAPAFAIGVWRLRRHREREMATFRRFIGPEEAAGWLPAGATEQLLAPTTLRSFWSSLGSTSHPVHRRRAVSAAAWALVKQLEAVEASGGRRDGTGVDPMLAAEVQRRRVALADAARAAMPGTPTPA